MQSNARQLKPEVLVRLMYCATPHAEKAIRIGSDIWMDADTAFGEKFDYGTRHDLTFDDEAFASGTYIVAMLPFLSQVAHPHEEGKKVPLLIVYLTSLDLWPQFEKPSTTDLADQLSP